MVTLWNGDCLDLMANIPDGSVDLVLCDLPYGTTWNDWDAALPMEALWSAYKRVVKRTGALVFTAAQPFTSLLVASNLDWFKYCWVWEKDTPTGFPNANWQPLRKHEDVCVFSPADAAPAATVKMLYNPQGLVQCGKVNRRGGVGRNYGAAGLHEDRYVQKFTNYPTTILKFPKDNETFHPTQKPVALGEYLIRTYTNEDETVLDNTMGSGSFGVAAVNVGRNFIGIERDPDYFAIAESRIMGTGRVAEEKHGAQQMLLFG